MPKLDASLQPAQERGIMQLYRVSEVAQMLDVHPNTVRKWVREEILRPVKLPGSHYNRFTAEEIDRLRRRMGLPADCQVHLYRVGQAARMFGVHPNTIRKWVRTAILRSIKLPGSDYNRFTLDELNRLRQQIGLPRWKTRNRSPHPVI
jgi:excisionase family DNA binding protein